MTNYCSKGILKHNYLQKNNAYRGKWYKSKEVNRKHIFNPLYVVDICIQEEKIHSLHSEANFCGKAGKFSKLSTFISER